MPKFTVEKSIQINVPAEKAFALVRDFKSWPSWSPWLIVEPECSVNYADDGLSYSWDGDVVGSGEMKIVDESANSSISYELAFFKPWKSQSTVRFSFNPTDEGTEVTWTMNGALPFFMFWMTKMMTNLIGMDYNRGLLMLKDKCETDEIPSLLSFPGKQAFNGYDYIGIKTSCDTDDIGDRMKADLESLFSAVENAKLKPVGKVFSIYHKFDISKQETEYTIGIPLESIPSELPTNIVSGSLPTMDTFPVEHTGPYRHLGNAWSAGIMLSRAKKFKQSRASHPFEVYDNDPQETPENELKTTVHFPSK